MTHPTALDTYERIADAYSRNVDQSLFNAHYERPATLELLGEVTGLDILDLGCGNGFYAEWCLEHGARKLLGVDYSPRMIEIARARVGGRAELVQGDLNGRLGMVPDASFDLALCSLALHYVSDWSVPLGEMHRALRPGGAVVLSVGHPAEDIQSSPSKRYFETELITENWPSYGIMMSSYRRSLTSMVDAFSQAGFRLERLLEPRPDEFLRAQNEKLYAHLMSAPAFICFRLRK